MDLFEVLASYFFVAIDWVNGAAFTVFDAPVSRIEVFGFVTGAACVWAVARQKIWNWPVGILNNIAFVILFFTAGLYGETILQVIFAVIAVYGWIKWSRGVSGKAGANDLPIRDATKVETIAGVVITIAATALIAFALHAGTDSQVPIPDAFVLAASLVATYAQAKKIFQHWYVWIVIDVVSIPLYFSRGLVLTGILYIGFLGLCIYGLVDWNKERKAQTTPIKQQVTAEVKA